MEVGPPQPLAQGEAANRRELRRHNGRGGERHGKGDPRDRQVWIGKTNEGVNRWQRVEKNFERCRKRVGHKARDKPEGDLLAARAASGV
jgi:hypothetical protein